ncbi:MAG: 5'-methylthioadenosine/adenosylhomocysteine nucleosidase [Clostridia bacterium]|nr:5'-methylthioadenosine/adenosylhomocysteine nucleosidase [Clostridia bacterium]
MIGIIGAMEIEIELINEQMKNKKSRVINGITFTTGFINSQKLVTAVCGMGKVNAAICAQTMICIYNPDEIINTGVAGGIDQRLKVGDIVISEGLYEHDLDITSLGYPLGFISGADITKIPSNREITLKLYNLANKILECNIITGIIVSGDQFINSEDKKAFLKEKFNAAACEMEGAAIGHVCYMNHVPFTVVRAVSDNAGGGADMDFNTFAKIAARNSSKLITEYVNTKGSN